jgi:hypothetical protein
MASSPDRTLLEGGAYEILKERLRKQGVALQEKVNALNEARRTLFGGLETKVLESGRIITQNNCIARDIVALGDKLIFGYDVFIGLKKDTRISDVFSVYEFRPDGFHEIGHELIGSEDFQRDFNDLFTYYRQARFATFQLEEGNLLMVFHVGKGVSDTKVFKWTVNADMSLSYVNNRAEREYQHPAQVQFQWRETTRDQHVYGAHPHVSIEDRIFVECVRGDLTIKVENNTETGTGIYAETVDDKDQKLDDAEISYATVQHLIFLRIKPYRENKYRYFVYNDKTRTAVRVDSIEHCALMLPEHDGVIFPDGYYLSSGEIKSFDLHDRSMKFRRLIKSPNGEDFLYVFYAEEGGEYVLLQYNLISKAVTTPLECHGYALYADGRMILFKKSDEAQKSHAIQIWQTPFVRDMPVAASAGQNGLSRIGNKALVTGIAELSAVVALTQKQQVYLSLYEDIVQRVGRANDLIFWLDDQATGKPREQLLAIKSSAEAAIDEYEKVLQLQRHAGEQYAAAEAEVDRIQNDIKVARFEQIDEFVAILHRIRLQRGKIITLMDIPYADREQLSALEVRASDAYGRVSQSCINFLLGKDALAFYRTRLQNLADKVPAAGRLRDLEELDKDVAEAGTHIQLLTDLIGSLNISDATDSAAIVENISALVSQHNQVKALCRKSYEDLKLREVKGEFAAQFRLLGQTVASYLDQAGTPDQCDELLAKVSVQLEDLEGRYSEFDEYISQISEKREEIYSVFTARKTQLQEVRNKRIQTLFASATRILKSVEAQSRRFKDITELNAYFAADMMVSKLRAIVDQVRELGDSAKAEDVASRIKSLEQEGARQLKDRNELFVDGADVVRFGEHAFLINTQPLELTTLRKNDEVFFHLNGTDFSEKIEDPSFAATREFWDVDVVSETGEFSRAEYLAWSFIQSVEGQGQPVTPEELTKLCAESSKKPPQKKKFDGLLQEFIAPRYAEGYEKGIHDHDAAAIVLAAFPHLNDLGLLRFHPAARAGAALFLCFHPDRQRLDVVRETCVTLGRLRTMTSDKTVRRQFLQQLESDLANVLSLVGWSMAPKHKIQAAAFLFEYLAQGEDASGMPVSPEAAGLARDFIGFLGKKDVGNFFRTQLKKLEVDPARQLAVAREWIERYHGEHGGKVSREFVDEVLAMVISGVEVPAKKLQGGTLTVSVPGLISSHARIVDGAVEIGLHNLFADCAWHRNEVIPRFHAYQKQKHDLISRKTDSLNLSELKPKVMSSFVRNKLVNDVYLPVIGANLAKQMGTYGTTKRTDLMGLLLLISPPGYGKTTLMEYVANRLGLIFMKINGPALGHEVTSVDPADAPNATAAKEIEKLNLAFEMGNNVMIYIDDIQHCNPEFLQKFISLCDGQRKIEGVWNGRTKTYDFRGKRVAVVMAGNPYTESGEKFRIPDMLANRADTYNLGDILDGHEDAFKTSYLENCLTSNKVLSRLTSQAQSDVYGFIRIARTGSSEGVEFKGNYSANEVRDLTDVFRKLITVQETILKVNRLYIESAGMDDKYRTEPPFLLQGSYRNMNRIAEKILPVMNDSEIEALIQDHFRFEAQLLTRGAEFNLLRFRAEHGSITESERQRLSEIRAGFVRQNRLGGVDGKDPMAMLISQMDQFNEQFSDLVEVARGRLKKAG